ncbi:FAD binding domain-containing protein [Jatrophihabitans sp. YIM 134969]
MDLETVVSYRRATSRADLALAPGERVLAGGTWLYSEPQVTTTGLVDLTTMGWPDLEVSDAGLRIGATCTIADLTRFPAVDGWRAQPLFRQCASALLASPKVWEVATVGGNICQSYAAAGMVSLAVALDGEAVVWRPDGGEHRVRVEDLVTGDTTNTLRAGEVLRAVDLPVHALRARTAYRKIALAELGRSGSVLTGRVDEDGSAVLTVTAATWRPRVLRFAELPSAPELSLALDVVDDWYTDPLGTADWREHVSRLLLDEIRTELAA